MLLAIINPQNNRTVFFEDTDPEQIEDWIRLNHRGIGIVVFGDDMTIEFKLYMSDDDLRSWEMSEDFLSFMSATGRGFPC